LGGRGIATETVGGMMVFGQLEYRLREIIVTLNFENGAS
jgi:hypothetical protein